MTVTIGRFRFAAFLLALTAGGFSLAARADDQSVALPDLAYLPGEGHFFTDTETSYAHSSGDYYIPVVFANGTPAIDKLGRYSLSLYTISQSLRYGVTNRFDVGIAESCGWVTDRIPGYFGASKAFDKSCGDPTLSARYRVIAQSDMAELPVNLDFSASYSPDLVKPDASGFSRASGGSSGGVSLTLSRVYEEFTLLAQGGAALYGRAKLADSYGYEEISSAYTSPYAGIQAQYKYDDSLFLTGGLLAYMSYGNNQRQSFSDAFGDTFSSGQRNRISTAYQPQMTASWLAVPDTLELSLRYVHTFGGDETSYNAGEASFAGQYRGVSGDTVLLDITILWF